MTSRDKQLRERLACSVCMEQYDGTAHSPMALPCQHTFCVTCLHDMEDATAHVGVLLCPSCRAPALIPNGGVEKFPKNLSIADVLDVLQEETSCELHPDQAAILVCVTCVEGLCIQCMKGVAKGPHKDHELEDFSAAVEPLAAALKQRKAKCLAELTERHNALTNTSKAEAAQVTTKLTSVCKELKDVIDRWESAQQHRLASGQNLLLAPTSITIKKMTEDIAKLESSKNNPNTSVAALMNAVRAGDVAMTTISSDQSSLNFTITFSDLLEDLNRCIEKCSGSGHHGDASADLLGDLDYLSLDSSTTEGACSLHIGDDGDGSINLDDDFGFGDRDADLESLCSMDNQDGDLVCSGCLSPVKGEWYHCSECSVAGDSYVVCVSCHGNSCHSQHSAALELFKEPGDEDAESYCDVCGTVFHHDTQIIFRCNICDNGNYDLCKKCHAKNHHSKHKGKFTKMRFAELKNPTETAECEPETASKQDEVKEETDVKGHVKAPQPTERTTLPHWTQSKNIIIRQCRDRKRNNSFIKVIQNTRSKEYIGETNDFLFSYDPETKRYKYIGKWQKDLPRIQYMIGVLSKWKDIKNQSGNEEALQMLQKGLNDVKSKLKANSFKFHWPHESDHTKKESSEASHQRGGGGRGRGQLRGRGVIKPKSFQAGSSNPPDSVPSLLDAGVNLLLQSFGLKANPGEEFGGTTSPTKQAPVRGSHRGGRRPYNRGKRTPSKQ